MIPRRAGIIRRHGRAGGFTLLELLLVLGLLVLMAAAAWPSLNRPLATIRLREGARGMCNELARARLRAIETGNVLVLRYEAGSARYEVTTRTAALEGSDPAAPNDDEFSGTATARAGTSRRWPAGAFDPVRGELPAGIRFVRADNPGGDPAFAGESLADDDGDSVDTDFDTPSTDVDDMAFDSMSGELSGGIAGGTVVYLYPDGTARDATIRLANQKSASIEITLRGMTGATRLGSVVEPEVSP
jgi:type II secretory pathway pseudopilin PulG